MTVNPHAPGAAPAASGTGGAAAESASRQVLTFVLGDETYGVDILRVQEIRGWSAVTKIPQAPAHVLGVLNLRGSIVPIVDLRMRFNLERAEYTTVTVIIVLSVLCGAARRDFGLVVDGVSDVVDVKESDVHPPPELGSRVELDYLKGLVPIAERMLVLLDIDRLIGADLVNLGASTGEAA
ncbi:MAG TPA: chemotaxis protein CheW [Steroidobacteraceae bacterium]|nr:chemotaxis protein CheW [Steroidobacteraceae bacterium]